MAGTIIVSLALVGVVSLVVRKLIKDRKQGGCSCGCAECSSKKSCGHP